MRIYPIDLPLCLVVFLGFTTAAVAAPLGVEVVSMRFNEPRIPGQSLPWLEAAITLRALRSNVEDVNLQLWMRFKSEAISSFTKNTSRTEIYSGKIRLYALDRNAVVRFYIPPDVVRVRRLTQTPEAWLVSLSSSYGAEPFDHSQSSAGITAQNSQQFGSSSSGCALLPHYYTPFYSLPETQRDLPSYVVP